VGGEGREEEEDRREILSQELLPSYEGVSWNLFGLPLLGLAGWRRRPQTTEDCSRADVRDAVI